MSHRLHPAEGDKPDALLFDYCEDCADKMKNLGVGLDVTRWPAMWRRMLVTEMPNTFRLRFPRERPGYRSRNEADLGRQMYHMYIVLERRGMDLTILDLGK
jgi:hypothetical protein